MANVSEECDRHVLGGRKRNLALQRAGEKALETSFQQVRLDPKHEMDCYYR